MASCQLLRHTKEQLADDVRQASEKGWGAAAQIVKGIGAHRGGNAKATGHCSEQWTGCAEKPGTWTSAVYST